MLYFITISLIILNLLFYKIHFLKTAVLISSLVFLFILNGWSSGGNDITNTMLRYDNTLKYVSYTEFLYNYITVTANNGAITINNTLTAANLGLASALKYVGKVNAQPS